jgi:hypothetical protein
MTQLHASAAALQIIGDTLEPDEITQLLGCSPTDSYRKGELLRTPSGRELTAQSGQWTLNARESEPGNLNGQITEILDQLRGDFSAWDIIGKKFQARIYCGLFTREWNESIEISPGTLACLSSRGIELTLELYAGPAPMD